MLNYRTETEKQMIDLGLKVQPLFDTKLDISFFSEFQASFYAKMTDITSNVDKFVGQIETNSNYLQKYVPMQTQRAITHILEFVFPQKDVAWRLNWYNELKMPMLSAALLSDVG